MAVRGAPVLGGDLRLSAGRRTHRVQIEQLSESEGTGFPVETWTKLGPPVWMSRLDVRADERFAAHQPSAFIETMWQMPYQCEMDPDLVDVPKTRRLVSNGRAYDIKAASAMGRHGIELMTLAGSRVP